MTLFLVLCGLGIAGYLSYREYGLIRQELKLNQEITLMEYELQKKQLIILQAKEQQREEMMSLANEQVALKELQEKLRSIRERRLFK